MKGATLTGAPSWGQSADEFWYPAWRIESEMRADTTKGFMKKHLPITMSTEGQPARSALARGHWDYTTNSRASRHPAARGVASI
jgi:hypothetical protein